MKVYKQNAYTEINRFIGIDKFVVKSSIQKSPFNGDIFLWWPHKQAHNYSLSYLPGLPDN